jgi:predicted transcriptional regulator
MPTTTIRIDDALKARLAAAAARSGKTPHGFILDAIAATVAEAEQADAFHRLAEIRWASLLASGESVPWDAAKTWLEARARGDTPSHPRARLPKR